MAVARASNIGIEVLDEMFELALQAHLWHAAREIRRVPSRHGHTLELTAREVRGLIAQERGRGGSLQVLQKMLSDIVAAEAYEQHRDARVSAMKEELPRLPFIEE